jgi:hypothetical protein
VELTTELYDNYDVTTSVIAIGAAGAAPFLEEMARVGQGNYHAVDIVENIPTIFTLEAVLATRSYILEEEFVPSLSANSPIMNGITAAPPLLGYVATTPKSTAQVILRGPDDYNDPLLAAWQYGLGRSVAFTSDATGRWAQNWVGWDDFPRFWSQAVRWTITEGTNNNLETRVVMEGEQARVIVDARDADGAFLNGLDLQTSVIDPELNADQVQLRQVAPGRYEATFTPGAEGAYFLRLAGAEGDIAVNQTTGWVMSYSPEYSLRPDLADTDLLSEIAALTNGRSLLGDPGAAFAHNLAIETASVPLWPWLLLAAMLLLPVDIAVRRLIITGSDLARARAALFGRRAAARETTARITGLMDAKARAQQKADEVGANVPAPGSTAAALRNRRAETSAAPPPERQPTGAPPAPPTSGGAQSDAPAPRPAAPPAPAPTPTPANGEDANIAGRLLKRRRERE